MTYKHHTKLDLVEGGNIFKQGDHPTLKFIGYDSLGNEVDLTGKQIEGALFNRNKGIIYEASASFADGRIVFTIDELLDNGKFQLEFTVTDSADPNYRAKFPSDEFAAELTIKPSKDNMDFVGVSMTTVAQLRSEQENKQQQFEQQIVPQVDEIKTEQQRLQIELYNAAAALTEDSEFALAKGTYGSVPERLNSSDQRLEEDAAQIELLKKNKAEKMIVENGLNLKRDKATKITGVDLDTSTDGNKVKLINLADEVQQALTGNAPALTTIADGAVGTTKIADGAGTRNKLADAYNYVGSIGAGVSLNTVMREGSYVVLGTALHLPPDITGTCILIVHNTNGVYIRQEVYDRFDVEKTFVRRTEPGSSTFGEWAKIITTNNVAAQLTDGSLGNTKLSDTFNYNGTVTDMDMKTINREGAYVAINATDKPIADTSGFLKVNRYADNIIQEYSSISYPASRMVYRRVKRIGQDFTKWDLITHAPNASYHKFETEESVTLGDSITGAAEWQGVLSKRLGMKVTNCGFGGTRMTYHTDPDYDKFSFTKLVDAKINNDFAAQDDAASRLDVTNMIVNLQNWKDVNLNNVQYLQIWFGNNDLSGDIHLGSNGSEDTTTFKGALQYGIRRLSETYPNLKIIVITPMFRLFLGGNSDDTPNANRGLYLRDYVQAAEEVAKINHVPCLNMNDKSGINKFNHTTYYSDGLHPYLPAGREAVAHKLAGFYTANF